MTVWYEAAFRHITPVHVSQESDQFVWVVGSRRKKITDWRSHFKTWDEAHAWLLSKAEEKMLSARRQLQYAQDEYGNVKGLRRPVTERDSQP